MIATTRSSGWFRRGAAGLAVLLAVGTLGAGLAGRLQMGARLSPVAAPAAEVVAVAPATQGEVTALQAWAEQERASATVDEVKAATGQYRASYDRTLGTLPQPGAVRAATAQYRAGYDSTLAGRAGSRAIKAATGQYRAGYDSAPATGAASGAARDARERYQAAKERQLERR